MVFLEYVRTEGDEVIYDYMPEKEDAPRGTISVNRRTRERSLLKESSADEQQWFMAHAWMRIEQMLDAGRLEKKTYAAWH